MDGQEDEVAPPLFAITPVAGSPIPDIQLDNNPIHEDPPAIIPDPQCRLTLVETPPDGVRYMIVCHLSNCDTALIGELKATYSTPGCIDFDQVTPFRHQRSFSFHCHCYGARTVISARVQFSTGTWSEWSSLELETPRPASAIPLHNSIAAVELIEKGNSAPIDEILRAGNGRLSRAVSNLVYNYVVQGDKVIAFERLREFHDASSLRDAVTRPSEKILRFLIERDINPFETGSRRMDCFSLNNTNNQPPIVDRVNNILVTSKHVSRVI